MMVASAIVSQTYYIITWWKIHYIVLNDYMYAPLV